MRANPPARFRREHTVYCVTSLLVVFTLGCGESRFRERSAENLKQLGLLGKMYADDWKGEMWPPLSTVPGQMAMDASAIFPDYLSDATLYISPAHPDYDELVEEAKSDPRAVIRDHSYWYLGYAMVEEAEGLELVKHIRKSAEAGKPLSDWIVAPALERGRIFRLQEGVERFYLTDANDSSGSSIGQSWIPIMIERPGMHKDGSNVLYLDGYVEFIPYPGKFPMTEKFIHALESLDDLKP